MASSRAVQCLYSGKTRVDCPKSQPSRACCDRNHRSNDSFREHRSSPLTKKLRFSIIDAVEWPTTKSNGMKSRRVGHHPSFTLVPFISNKSTSNGTRRRRPLGRDLWFRMLSSWVRFRCCHTKWGPMGLAIEFIRLVIIPMGKWLRRIPTGVSHRSGVCFFKVWRRRV